MTPEKKAELLAYVNLTPRLNDTPEAKIHRLCWAVGELIEAMPTTQEQEIASDQV